MKFTTENNHRLPPDMNIFQFITTPILKLPVVLRNMIENASTGKKLDKYFKSNKLKNILDINIAYYADDPYKLSWFYHSSAQYGYYNSSVFIKGGSQVLSNQLLDVVLENGGEIRFNSEVKEIVLEGNKAKGAVYLDKKSKEMITVSAKKIVANCSPDSVLNGNMVPSDFRESKVEKLENSSSLYTVYIIFKEKVSSIYKDSSYSTFIGDDRFLDMSLSKISEVLTKSPVEERPFVFVDYSVIDSGLVPENDKRGFGVFCSVSNISDWENMSEEEYKQKKEHLAKVLFERLEYHYPNIKEYVEYSTRYLHQRQYKDTQKPLMVHHMDIINKVI